MPDGPSKVSALTAASSVTGADTVYVVQGGVSKKSLLSTVATYLSSLFAPLTDSYRRNPIINGDFQIWQRGTTFTSVADGAYTADRWRYNKIGVAVHDISRSSDVPTVAQAGRLFNYSILVDCTTADASVTGTDFSALTQLIEGNQWVEFAQRAVTVSFWVKATKTGTYCVSLRNSGVDRSYVAEYTVSAADAWEYKTVNILASPSAGTWDYTTGVGVYLQFMLSCGASLQTSAGSWLTGNALASANQVNATDSTANNFRICGVQLEAGSTATAFKGRSTAEELVLCQRYYQVLYAYSGRYVDTTNFHCGTSLPVAMRATPTASLSASPTVHEFGVAFRTITSITNGPTAAGGRMVLVAGTATSGNSGNVEQGSILLSAEL